MGLNINTDEYDVLVTFMIISDRFSDITPRSPGDGWVLVDFKTIQGFCCTFLWTKKKSFNNSGE